VRAVACTLITYRGPDADRSTVAMGRQSTSDTFTKFSVGTVCSSDTYTMLPYLVFVLLWEQDTAKIVARLRSIIAGCIPTPILLGSRVIHCI
jgi:hypothetical protein